MPGKEEIDVRFEWIKDSNDRMEKQIESNRGMLNTINVNLATFKGTIERIDKAISGNGILSTLKVHNTRIGKLETTKIKVNFVVEAIKYVVTVGSAILGIRYLNK